MLSAKETKKKMKNVSVTSTRRSKYTKKECPRYVAWHVKKGKSLAEVNLAVTYHSHLFAHLVIFFIKLTDTIYCQSNIYCEN